MMQDRNLTSHTYHESLATEIVQRVQSTYCPALKAVGTRLQSTVTELPPQP
jgi:nucleotidyltransferase-like protein